MNFTDTIQKKQKVLSLHTYRKVKVFANVSKNRKEVSILKK